MDVRDIAGAHLKAYELEEAGGERFIVGSHFDYQTAVDCLRKAFHQLHDRIPAGPNPGVPVDTYAIDHTKSERVLGVKYTPLAVTLTDTAEDLLNAEKNQAA